MLIHTQTIGSVEDKTKFEQIYEKYRRMMFYVANKILQNEHDAEDAVHQAFISIIENLEKIPGAESPKTKGFCIIVVERKALMMLRERRRFADDYDVEMAGIEVTLSDESELSHAMAQLPARYREALLLRFHMGYSTKEVAGILEISHSNTLKLIWRAKQALQKLLEGGTYGNE